MKYRVFLLITTVLVSIQVYGSIKFPEIEGWNSPDKIHTYNPDNLFEIINGAAVIYLDYDFKKHYRGEYTEKADTNNYITVQIYQHASVYDAFGIYSAERPGDAKYNSLGVSGYTAGSLLSFYKGQYYVIITSHDESESTLKTINELGKRLASKLAGDNNPPKPIIWFPNDGLVSNSVQYINKQFLGYDVLSNAFIAKYKNNGKTYKAFIIPNTDRATCKAMLQDYAKKTGTTLAEIREGKYTIEDEYNGTVILHWQEKYLYGFYNFENQDAGNAVMQQLKKNIGF